MKKYLTVALVISLILNFGLVYQMLRISKSAKEQEEIDQERYPYIAKRMFLESPNDVIIDFTGLRKEMREYILPQKEQIGLYFEYLPTGVSIGINEKEPFRRASLIKIPTVMKVYKLIEEGRLAKDKELTVLAEQLDQGFGNLWKRGAGFRLTVAEAIQFALVDSDNTAANLLEDTVNDVLKQEQGSEAEILSLYDFLDIPKEPQGLGLDISPKGFTSVLKSLFFPAYLNYENSNEILSILSKRQKPYGFLADPIPQDIAVSDKFGVNQQGTEKSLITSDCGIVYLPKRPYVLCIMISRSPAQAGGKITVISKMVYEFVKNANSR